MCCLDGGCACDDCRCWIFCTRAISPSLNCDHVCCTPQKKCFICSEQGEGEMLYIPGYRGGVEFVCKECIAVTARLEECKKCG